MALDEFPCKTRANTNEFNSRYTDTFPTGRKKTFCPFCDVAVSGEDKECWRCKEDLTDVTLKMLKL